MPTARPSWTRLEPQPRDPSMATGVRAEVHDPLWLLARQLQLGELTGEDAGSPVWVDLQGKCDRLTRYHPGPPDRTPGRPYDPRQPLEALVEAEPAAPEDERPLRLAATAGLHFVRLLHAELDTERASRYAAAYQEHFPLPDGDGLDPAARRFHMVLAGRAPDGVALYRALAAAGQGLPAAPAITPDDTAAVTRAARNFMAWYQALAGPTGPSAWTPARFEYQFAVAGPLHDGERAEVVLTASEYDQGRLDWYSFDLTPAGTTLGAASDPAGTADLHRPGLPHPVRYRGMPEARFWQFEDAAVDFGDFTAAPEDLTTPLLIEFATVYGNDHFIVEVDIDIGSICQVTRLVVTDTFGHTTEVPHVAKADKEACRPGVFRLFELGAGATRSPLFLLPPTLGLSLDGPPIEEVRLLRDEGANLGWAVEATAAKAGGFPVDREAAWQANRPDQPPPADGEPVWRYRLRTPVPDPWIPLVPIPDPGQIGSFHLELGLLPPLDETPPPASPPAPAAAPWGRILAELAELAVPEEELSRAATRVTRAWQYTRWTDGRQHTWIGRRRAPARSQGDSGLRFDTIEPTTHPHP